jgi:hypothetical protein
MTMIITPRTRVAVGVKGRRNFAELIARANAVQAAIAANPALFPSANPTAAAFQAQIKTLEAAQQRTTAKQPGASADRNAAADVVNTSLGELRTYVQGLCDASPEKAAQIVAAAAMKVVVSNPAHKPIIAAMLGIPSGNVALRANKHALVGKTSAMCTFNWEYSLDGQKTWISVLGTPVPATTIAGLPPLATVSFRVSVTTKKATGAYCQAVSIIVH